MSWIGSYHQEQCQLIQLKYDQLNIVKDTCALDYSQLQKEESFTIKYLFCSYYQFITVFMASFLFHFHEPLFANIKQTYQQLAFHSSYN